MKKLGIVIMTMIVLNEVPLIAGEVLPWGKIPKETGQLIHVQTPSSKSTQGKLAYYGRNGPNWEVVGKEIPIVVGMNGITKPEIKKEGDGKTPAGLYRIGLGFGYGEKAETNLAYKQMTKDDLWIDDDASPDYNRMVKAPTLAKSFEFMRRDDNAYKLGAVIEYNTNPIIAGKGSAIFMHLWSGPTKPTAGCIAMSEENMTFLFRWLDKNKGPMILIETGAGQFPK
ncbi:MAG: hypothetical protein EBT92_07005 [Planctomycetes bacterium]|nr:hypothetical protein [Planctomycetota bacterium]